MIHRTLPYTCQGDRIPQPNCEPFRIYRLLSTQAFKQHIGIFLIDMILMAASSLFSGHDNMGIFLNYEYLCPLCMA